MFLCIYLPSITDFSVGTASVMNLPLHVKSLCCEEMLVHILGAMQLCPYDALPVTAVLKFQQLCLILEQQHANEAILLYAFGAGWISAYSRPVALHSCAPHAYVLCVMPCSRICAFISVCVLPSFIPATRFYLTGSQASVDHQGFL